MLGALNFVLLPRDQLFAVLCTTEDYFIVAGSEVFVKEAIGGDISEARKQFWQFASTGWPDRESWHRTQAMLMAVAKGYASHGSDQRG